MRLQLKGTLHIRIGQEDSKSDTKFPLKIQGGQVVHNVPARQEIRWNFPTTIVVSDKLLQRINAIFLRVDIPLRAREPLGVNYLLADPK